jgi:hypothetical protein
MVEFDVRERRGELVLAHTIFHAARGGNVLLGDALAHPAGERFAGVDLNVDVKHPGLEARLLDDLRGAGLLERTLLDERARPEFRREISGSVEPWPRTPTAGCLAGAVRVRPVTACTRTGA